MNSTEKPIRVKVIRKGMCSGGSIPEKDESWGNCLFIYDADCADYDWVVVYDEIPKGDVGTLRDQAEPLRCPPEHTLLVTSEPPSIKLYGTPYLRQFGTVLSTHSSEIMNHPDHVHRGGAYLWFHGKSYEDIHTRSDFSKEGILSTVCSAKQGSHTLHTRRYDLVKYLSERLPELDWYGRGVRDLGLKAEALDGYRYHIAIENFYGPHHWSEKLADSYLGLCLPFYVGHPSVAEYFPEDSYILLPLDDPEEAYRLIREAIDGGEFEKRLSALHEARELVLNKYHFKAMVAEIIESRHKEGRVQAEGVLLKGRHRLRRNPLNLVTLLFDRLRYRRWCSREKEALEKTDL